MWGKATKKKGAEEDMVDINEKGVAAGGLKLPWLAALALASYVVGGLWWGSNLAARVETAERTLAELNAPRPLQERLATIEAQQGQILEAMREIRAQFVLAPRGRTPFAEPAGPGLGGPP